MSELTRKKNEASEIMFAMVDSTTPANLKSGLTVTGDPYYKDDAGAWTTLTISDTSSEIGSTGMYTIEMTAAELNHDLILIKLTGTGAADTIVVIRTTTHDIDDVNIVVPDAAGVAPTAAEIKTEIEQAGSSLASILEDTGDLQTNQGAWATATGFATVNPPSSNLADYKADVTNLDVAVSTRNATTPPTVAEIRTEMEGAGTKLTSVLEDTNELQTNQGNWLTADISALALEASLNDIKGTGFVKDTHSLPQCLTATGFSVPNEYDTVIAALQTDLDNPTQYKATGFSTHSAADIWAVGTRALTDKAGFSLLSTGANLILKDSLFALAMADAIWDEILTGATHNIATSAGKRVRQIGAYAIHDGTAQAGTATSITLATTASADNGIYNRNLLVVTAGTGIGQTRTIVYYDGTTKVCGVDRDWRITPDATSEYQIVPDDTPLTVDHGFVQAATATTITLRDFASDVDDIYLHNSIAIIAGTGAGETRLVKAYNGTTKVLTIYGGNWITTPDTSSVYVLMPYGCSCVGNIDDGALAQINTECDAALTDYDPPTRTEATTDKNAIITEVNGNEMKIDTIDGVVDAILVDTGTTLENHLVDIKGTGFVKDTHSLPQCLTAVGFSVPNEYDTVIAALQTDLDNPDQYKATGFSTHSAADVKTEIEQAGSSLAQILTDTDDLQTNQGAWATATGFSTHNAAAVWSVATRILTANTNLNDLSAAEMKAEVVAALADIKLDHLINIAVDTDWATTVHLDSVIGHLADVGTAATFDRTQESMEAIRSRGDAAWTTGSETGLSPLAAGTAQAGTAGTITLAAGATATNDLYKGARILITGGIGVGQGRIVTAYDGTTKVVSVAPNWVTTPNATSTYEIQAADSNVGAIQNDGQGATDLKDFVSGGLLQKVKSVVDAILAAVS